MEPGSLEASGVASVCDKSCSGCRLTATYPAFVLFRRDDGTSRSTRGKRLERESDMLGMTCMYRSAVYFQYERGRRALLARREAFVSERTKVEII